MNTNINSPANQRSLLMSGNSGVKSDSATNKTTRREVFSRVVCSTAFGVCTAFVNHMVNLKMNDPVIDYLNDHCFNNKTGADYGDYSELTPYFPNLLVPLAITSTAFFVFANMDKVFDGCKSISDRVCRHFSAPDAAVRQPETEDV
ncbi:hypothetical protein [Endozoicomonas sp. ONNA2]|uniref:hypothetical protein n=1 Tax=Endozoicomonas sp. ONNA2 TaxID=2828741 RepID=UPI0021484032|nr:hypothetical protein [Endozoicomonas sp. ONNA2]